jgi:ABC-type bacteriocin/lantibiotic exporter with double-glycine peptidase domain
MVDESKQRGSKVRPDLKYIWESISSYKKMSVGVITVVIMDMFLVTLGIGIILPIFQTIISTEVENQWITKIVPGYADYSPAVRIKWLSIFIVGVVIVKSVVSLSSACFSRYFSSTMRCYWSKKIAENIMYGDYVEFIKKKPGVVFNDWMIEPVAASRFLTSYISYLSYLLLTILLIILGFSVQWKVMIYFIGGVSIFLMVAKNKFFGTAIGHSRLQTLYNQEVSALMNESLGHLKDIKILASETKHISAIIGIMYKIRALYVKMVILRVAPRVTGEMLAFLSLVGLLIYVSKNETLNIVEILPTILFFFVACYKIVTSGSQTLTSRAKAYQDFNSLLVVNNLCKVQPNDDRSLQTKGLSIDKLETDIVFENMSFAYGKDKVIFNQFNLVIPRGKITFIGGGSGSGKSTFLDLLLRIVVPQSGIIRVNNQNINEFYLSDWRKKFGYVSQDASLFHGTILDNIFMGNPLTTKEKIIEACEVSGCMDFINNLPDGIDTVVGDRGYTLSGGQRKRIAIARAIIRKPSVLIFDEATTSFETKIEKEIISKLKTEDKNLTIIQTSHRFDSQQYADFVINLDDIN